DALMEMSRKGLGMTAVVDQQDRLVGVFTDGDLRRAVDQGVDIYHSRVGDLMTRNSRTVGPDDLAVEALLLMETHKINALLVVDQDNVLVGALNMHDLLRAGVV
ncbi:MAG TPA: CBS domain-containing protein, partial [Candidatus Tenderia electrophaga]|nr:CBS domain-containing protein [Candidatus Tenderia electrophaga]